MVEGTRRRGFIDKAAVFQHQPHPGNARAAYAYTGGRI